MWSALVLAMQLSAPAVPITPVGDYVCSGQQNGEPYSLAMRVEAVGQLYNVAWFDQRGLSQYGFGFVDADRFVVLIVNARKTGHGVALYVIERGILRGKWAGGGETIEQELCQQAAVRSV